MATYAVMVVLDLDVDFLDSTKASEVEKITKNTVEIYLQGRERGVRVKMIRAKLLGVVKEVPRESHTGFQGQGKIKKEDDAG